jgi:hypothetical protein
MRLEHRSAATPYGRLAGSSPVNLPLTGERTVPGIAEENYWLVGS